VAGALSAFAEGWAELEVADAEAEDDLDPGCAVGGAVVSCEVVVGTAPAAAFAAFEVWTA
jgi:hypothetical protein